MLGKLTLGRKADAAIGTQLPGPLRRTTSANTRWCPGAGVRSNGERATCQMQKAREWRVVKGEVR